jgi:hypothetical protein
MLLLTTDPVSLNILLLTTDLASPNNIPLSTMNCCLRANGPPVLAKGGHGLVTVPASSLEKRHSDGATTILSDRNEYLLAPMSSIKETGLETTPVPASLLEEGHSDGATTLPSDQNECLLAPMSSMNETRLATTPSAESRPAEE